LVGGIAVAVAGTGVLVDGIAVAVGTAVFTTTTGTTGTNAGVVPGIVTEADA
jgi:hypothetical protein